jgi:GxxExxY protein
LHELKLRGIEVRNELDLPIMYKGLSLDCGYHVDLLVLGEVAVEVKAIDKRHPIHEAHLLTYLRVGGWKVGWLINFKVPVLKDGIKRRVLNF